MKSKIVIFGATGGTGQELIKQALEQGYKVTAFARSPQKINVKTDNLTIIKGDVLHLNDVTKAIKGQDIVLCSIGMPPGDKSNLRTEGTKVILQAMQQNGVSRFICQTSLGYGDSEPMLPWHMKYIVAPFILKNVFKDHALQEAVIEKSSTNWTIIRPGSLTDGQQTGRYKVGFNNNAKIKLKVSRADVAEFMLMQIDDNQYIHQKVGVSY